jgi:hypothetical protein
MVIYANTGEPSYVIIVKSQRFTFSYEKEERMEETGIPTILSIFEYMASPLEVIVLTVFSIDNAL